MNKYALILLYLIQSHISQAQKEVFAFPITDYIIKANDSITIVQVQLPDGDFTIPKDQVAILKANHQNSNTDSNLLGSGRCQLIKGDYYYFGIKLKNTSLVPKKADLINTFFNYPANYKGLIYQLIRQSIYLDHVTENPFYEFNTAQWLTQQSENALLDSLKEDIRYTAKVMQETNNGQDQVVVGGDFDGKKLFASMQEINVQQVKDFIEYMIARHAIYAGNHWKIAEIFATWMVNKTPKVIKD